MENIHDHDSGAEQTDNSFDFRSAKHSETILQNLGNLLRNQQLRDLALVTAKDGKRIWVHRNVLASASKYFDCMFKGSMVESNKQEITLHDVDGDILELLVKFIYTGCIRIQNTNVEALLGASNFLQVTEVNEACCDFLVKQLDESNWLDIECLADLYSCKTLLNRSLLFTCKHFMDVRKYENFLEMSSKRLVKMLECNDLNVSSEKDVFHAVISWLQHDIAREKFAPELLALVRLSLVPPTFISECLNSLNELPNGEVLKNKISECCILAENQTEAQPRKSTKGRCFAIIKCNEKYVIEKYCPIFNEWSLVTSTSNQTPLLGCTLRTVFFNDMLIMLGGFITDDFIDEGGSVLKAVNCLDVNTLNWSSLNPMNSYRFGHCVAVLNGFIYAAGGMSDNYSQLNTVERYNPNTNTWQNVASMSEERMPACVVVLNNLMYVIGGSSRHEVYESVECYNPNKNIWTRRASLNLLKGKYKITATVMNKFIYLLGQCRNKADMNHQVQRYDAATKRWTSIASLHMLQVEYRINIAVLGDSLMVFGSGDCVEKYNAQKDEWIKGEPLKFYSRERYENDYSNGAKQIVPIPSDGLNV